MKRQWNEITCSRCLGKLGKRGGWAVGYLSAMLVACVLLGSGPTVSYAAPEAGPKGRGLFRSHQRTSRSGRRVRLRRVIPVAVATMLAAAACGDGRTSREEARPLDTASKTKGRHPDGSYCVGQVAMPGNAVAHGLILSVPDGGVEGQKREVWEVLGPESVGSPLYLIDGRDVQSVTTDCDADVSQRVVSYLDPNGAWHLAFPENQDTITAGGETYDVSVLRGTRPVATQTAEGTPCTITIGTRLNRFQRWVDGYGMSYTGRSNSYPTRTGYVERFPGVLADNKTYTLRNTDSGRLIHGPEVAEGEYNLDHSLRPNFTFVSTTDCQAGFLSDYGEGD